MLHLALVVGLLAQPGAAAHWVGTWATAPQLVEVRNLPPAPGLAGATLRQSVKVSIGGSELRVHLSNQYGNAPLIIRAAQIALPAGPGAIVRSTHRNLTFSHLRSIIIPRGVTITPFGGSFYDSPSHEADWRTVSPWIRHDGAFDAVIDLAAVSRDPAHPNHLLPAGDLGDHLHFNPAGYARLAASIPLHLFELP